MFQLADLLWIDDEYEGSPGGIADCFGDRFLCNRNSLFRAVRLAFLANGGSFREASSFELGRRYLAAPLFCLADILKDSTIPYKATTPAIRQLVEMEPEFELAIPTMAALVTPNYLLHESCHCISDDLLRNHQESSSDRRIANAICGEAFANSVERLAMAEVAAPADGAFFTMNSYMVSLKAAPVIREAIDKMGFASVFSLAMLSYFCSNLRPEPPSPDVVAAFLRESGFPCTDNDDDLVRQLSQRVFTLRSSFREDTSTAYFRLIGLEEEFRAFTQRPFDDSLLRDAQLVSHVAAHVSWVTEALQRGSVPQENRAYGMAQ